MSFKRLQVFWSVQAKSFVRLAILCAALTPVNLLFWMTYWKRSGMELSCIDVVLASAEPSFSFLILIPFCLILAERNYWLCRPERVIALFSSRRQVFRLLIGLTVCNCCALQTIVSLITILTGLSMFDGTITMNWDTLGSHYWHSTGQILKIPLNAITVILWQWLSSLVILILFSLLFLVLSAMGSVHHISRSFGWIVCLALSWCCSFPVTPTLANFQRTVCFSARTIANNSVFTHILVESIIAILECVLLWRLIKAKDFI